MSEQNENEVAAAQPTVAVAALEREIAQNEKWGDWDRVADLMKKLERTKKGTLK